MLEPEILPEAAEADVVVLNKLLAGDAIYSAFQPIIDLKTGEIFAFEALARCRDPYFQTPPHLFAAAILGSRCGLLGRRLRSAAVEAEVDVPLFLNVHPNEFDEGWLVRPDDPVFWHDAGVYLEITESVPLSHFQQCSSVLGEMRSKGVALAVDDLGAGFSNLRYISDLSPEVVKLDRGLVMDLDSDARRRILVKGIIRMCHGMGARVVAEGIETAAELKAVLAAGADFGQGFLFARPAYPPPDSVWPSEIPKP